jgi:hypothetical protein
VLKEDVINFVEGGAKAAPAESAKVDAPSSMYSLTMG